jgi:hypothetical protein
MQNGSLSLVRGDDVDVGLQINNPDQTAYNLSGCALTFTARQNAFFSTVLLTKTVTQHLSNTGGTSQFSFVPADTLSMDDTTHYFDIKLTSASGKISTLMYGDLTIRPT